MISNISQLTEMLTRAADQLEKGEIQNGKATALSIIAGRLISVERLKLDFAKSRDERPDSKFMR